MSYATTPHAHQPAPNAPPAQDGPEWKCTKCSFGFPTDALTAKVMGGSTFLQCPNCAGEVRWNRPPPIRATFYEKLPGSFVYPLCGWSSVLVLFGAIMLFFTEFALKWSPLRTLPVFLALLGYLFSWIISIINRTADGDDELPNFPAITVGLLRNFGLFFGLKLVCFLPLILYVAGIFLFDFSLKLAIFPLMFGILVFPMAEMRVAMFETLEALNPFKIIQSIATVPTAYACTCLVFVFLMYVGVFMKMLLSQVPLAGGFLGTYFDLYVFVVEARLLGLIYFAYEEELDWFASMRISEVAEGRRLSPV